MAEDQTHSMGELALFWMNALTEDLISDDDSILIILFNGWIIKSDASHVAMGMESIRVGGLVLPTSTIQWFIINDNLEFYQDE